MAFSSIVEKRKKSTVNCYPFLRYYLPLLSQTFLISTFEINFSIPLWLGVKYDFVVFWKRFFYGYFSFEENIIKSIIRLFIEIVKITSTSVLKKKKKKKRVLHILIICYTEKKNDLKSQDDVPQYYSIPLKV